MSGHIDSRQSGNKFEDLAVEFLLKRNFKIIKRNFYYGKIGEIDIIAEEGDTLVFIEVKARTNENYGLAINSITEGKKNKFRKTCQGYLHINNITDKDCRIDVVAIDVKDSIARIKHIKNAF